MATEIPVLTFTRAAAADLSAQQYRFVKLDASGDIAAIGAATDQAIGVLQNKPDAAGKAAEVMVMGISKVEADAALNEADLIGPSADGQADAKVPGTDTSEFICGQMISATSGAGVLGTAAINCSNIARGA